MTTTDDDDDKQRKLLRAAMASAVGPMFERLERRLRGTGIGAMLWVYTRRTTDLAVMAFETDESTPLEALRVVRATAGEMARKLTSRESRRYVAPTSTPATELTVSAARVSQHGEQDYVQVWSRNIYAGELVVRAGDGKRLCEMMFMLEEERDGNN